jgi:hypothetical protein
LLEGFAREVDAPKWFRVALASVLANDQGGGDRTRPGLGAPRMIGLVTISAILLAAFAFVAGYSAAESKLKPKRNARGRFV